MVLPVTVCAAVVVLVCAIPITEAVAFEALFALAMFKSLTVLFAIVLVPLIV